MRKAPLHDIIPKHALHHREPRTGTNHDSGVPEAVDAPPARRKPAPADVVDTPSQRLQKPVSYDASDLDTDWEPDEQHGNRRWLTIAVIVLAGVVVSSFSLSLVFAGATITAFPKQDTVVINTNLTTQINGEGGTLAFERVAFEGTEEQTLIALGEEQVEERASGSITIYNEYSDTPQRLIKNTRFQAPSGNIYRIRESVEVPGRSSGGDAGSIDVTVVAEEPGDTYNLPEATTFSIPGFVGLPQDGKVYARSTSAIVGGFVGVRRTIAEEDRTHALSELETRLRDRLLAQAFEQGAVRDGYQLFKNALYYEFVEQAETYSGADKVVVRLKGTLHGVLFDRGKFAQRVAALTLPDYTSEPIRIDNIEELSVTLTPSTSESETTGSEATNPWSAASYNMRVEGKGHFIWEFDDVQLANDLAGKEKSLLDRPRETSILAAYPGIDRLQATIRPFWTSTFPEDSSDIVVITELDG